MFFSQSLSFLATLVFALSFVNISEASTHALRRRHPAVNALSLERRAQFENARFTNYKTGLGACGKTNSDGDFIVALNVPQYSNGAHCFETITLSYNGKTTQAQVVDECMECPFGAIDLSPGLFSFLADGNLGAGTIYGSWSFGAGEPPKPSTTSTPPPSSTPKPSKTSTPPPPPPSTSHTPTSTSSSTSSAPPTSTHATSTSSSASATPTQPAIDQGGLNSINQAFIGLAALAAVGGTAQ